MTGEGRTWTEQWARHDDRHRGTRDRLARCGSSPQMPFPQQSATPTHQHKEVTMARRRGVKKTRARRFIWRDTDITIEMPQQLYSVFTAREGGFGQRLALE